MSTLKNARERLRERQVELGHDAKKSLGQNFLISDSVIHKILQAPKEFHPASLIEIGPGMGALTDGLRLMNLPLRLLELDSNFAQYWRGHAMDLVEVDALQWHWNLDDLPRPLVLVSNLPYQISSSLVVDRSMDENPPDAMVLMFQKEVAQRIRANTDHGTYGFLSVLAQTFWKIETVADAAPGDFLPAPKVASRVLLFRAKLSPVQNRRKYLKFLKACFLHPRKYLLSNLAEGMGQGKEKVRELFEAGEWDPQIRGDQLAPEKFLELYRLFER